MNNPHLLRIAPFVLVVSFVLVVPVEPSYINVLLDLICSYFTRIFTLIPWLRLFCGFLFV